MRKILAKNRSGVRSRQTLKCKRFIGIWGSSISVPNLFCLLSQLRSKWRRKKETNWIHFFPLNHLPSVFVAFLVLVASGRRCTNRFLFWPQIIWFYYLCINKMCNRLLTNNLSYNNSSIWLKSASDACAHHTKANVNMRQCKIDGKIKGRKIKKSVAQHTHTTQMKRETLM